MATELKEGELLVEDISPDLLQAIAARARINGPKRRRRGACFTGARTAAIGEWWL